MIAATVFISAPVRRAVRLRWLASGLHWMAVAATVAILVLE